jgi:hypothetical protein
MTDKSWPFNPQRLSLVVELRDKGSLTGLHFMGMSQSGKRRLSPSFHQYNSILQSIDYRRGYDKAAQRRLIRHAARCWYFVVKGMVKEDGIAWALGSLDNLYLDQGNQGKDEETQGKEKALGPAGHWVWKLTPGAPMHQRLSHIINSVKV